MKIKAAVVWEKGGPFRIEEVELDGPKEDEVLVRNVASGICHTDLAARDQELPVPLPVVLGHEGCGVVEAVGGRVRDLAPGDPVVVSYAYCGECPSCVAGKTAACEKMGPLNFGGMMGDGTGRITQGGKKIGNFFGQSSFAEYTVANYRSVVKVDRDIDLKACAPLGCGIQTGAGAVLNVFRPRFGESIAVFGCGSVGMSAIMAARVAGCEEIIAVGGNPASLELARELGATGTVNRKDHPEAMALGGRVRELTHGGAHYVLDTSGNETMIHAGLMACRGTFSSVGMSAMGLNLPFFYLSGKTIVSIVEGDANPRLFIPRLLAYHRQGRFPFDRLNRYYPFAEIDRAVAESHRGDTIKAVVTF